MADTSNTIHEVRFHTRGPNRADAHAKCTCGWFTFGSLEECQDAAAVHDDWEAVEVEQSEAVA